MSMCFGSFWRRLRVMSGVFPVYLVRSAWRVLIVCGCLRSAKTFLLVMRYILSFVLEILGFLLWVG